MNRNSCKYSMPKKKKKRRCSSRKIGAALIALGSLTAFMLLLPLEYWVVLMCAVLMICGLILVKSSR